MNTCSQLILSAICGEGNLMPLKKGIDVLSTNKYANIAAWLMLV